MMSAEKIVLAIQIKDFVVRTSTKMKSGYLPLDISNSQGIFINAMKNIMGWGNYYKPMFSLRKIK